MRLYFFIHYSNTNANSYNHIISFAQKVYTFKKVFPIIVLNSDSYLFYFRKGCLHISKRIFLSVSDLLPKDSILHFWSVRRYIEEYYYTLVNRFKLVIHLEDNYSFLSQCYSNNCFSKSDSLFILRKFKYITSINKNLSTLYSIPESKFFLLKPPTIIHKRCTYNENSNILHLGTINQYNRDQIRYFIKTNFNSFILVGKNFYPDFFYDFKNCFDYGFVNERDLNEILSNTLISFVPYLAHDFDYYRYPSKVPDLLTAGVPTLLPNYEYYQEIFDHFPELKYDRPKKGKRDGSLADLIEKARCESYRKKLSKFAKDYFANQKRFLDFVSIVR